MPRDRSEASRDADDFIRRLEERIHHLIPEGGKAFLAYSGGLASTIVALVARKRCDLECVVAGSPDSPDLRAAESARLHLDLRIESLLLDEASIGQIRDWIADVDSGLSHHAIASLVPVVAVVEQWKRESWLSGFGCPRVEPRLATQLRRLAVRAPLADASARSTIPRRLLRSVATSLGAPEAWVRVEHRPPEVGAGVVDFL